MWDLLQALFPLFLIIILLFAALYFIKKYGLNFNGGKTKSVSFKNLGTQMIMPKKFISAVKFQDKVFILGIGESITLLKEIDEKDLNSETPTTTVNGHQVINLSEKPENFMDVIKKNLGLR